LDTKRLVERRAELGLTHFELAKKAGVSEDTLGRAENGRRIRLDSAGRIAEALQSALSELLPRLMPPDPLAPHSRWSSVSTFNPDLFVGREQELARCREILSYPKDVAHVIIVTGPSSAGKTTFLRKLGYELSLKSVSSTKNAVIVFLDGGTQSGELVASLFRQLGDVSAGLGLFPKRGYNVQSELDAAKHWGRQLARGVSRELCSRTVNHIAAHIRNQDSPPTVILDDVQDIKDGTVTTIVRALAETTNTAVNLVCAWRLDVPSDLARELRDTAQRNAPKWGDVIKLGGFTSPKDATQFFERRLGQVFVPLPKAASLSGILDLLPGDLDEIARFLRERKLESLDSSVLRKFAGGPNAINLRRWQRLEAYHDDLRLLSVAGVGAPLSLLLRSAKGHRIRLRELVEIEAAWESHRIGGVWCKVFPEGFSEFIWTHILTDKTRRRFGTALIRAIASDLEGGRSEPELLQVAKQVAARMDVRTTLIWSARLGRWALKRGWLRSSLDMLAPFLVESNLPSMKKQHRELTLDCVNVERQMGYRDLAIKLLDRIDRLCHFDNAQLARSISLRLRLVRDLKGGEIAHRTAKRLMKSHVCLNQTAEFLNQRARIARDRGRIAEGTILAKRALTAASAERRSFRSLRMKSEVLYTLGSIERLAGNFKSAAEALQRSRDIRQRQEDGQGEAYCLIELAFCALVQEKKDDCISLLNLAEKAASNPEIQDQRALAYSDIVRSMVAVMSGDKAEARLRLSRGRKWDATKEEGIRGNPFLLEAVIEARFGFRDKAVHLLQSNLNLDDRTVRATASVVLAQLLLSSQESLLRNANWLAARHGFSLKGIGANLLAGALPD
jgi:transcriptional regulator with XRE-family HTH domain/tetratricopeptide (TPR) repeat protein